MTREWFYGTWQYDRAGIDPFSKHAAAFLAGNRRCR